MRLHGLGLTSRYALAHLFLVVVLLLSGGAAGERFVFTVFAFPLPFALLLLPDPDRLPVSLSLGFVVTIWVLNSYLWGAVLGIIHRRLSRVSRPSLDPPPVSAPPANPGVIDH